MRNDDKAIVQTYAADTFIPLTLPSAGFKSPRLNEDQRVFAYERYAEEIHPPIAIELPIPLGLQELPRCLDMPIRLKDEEEYRLPEDWAPLKETLEHIIAVEHEHNPSWRDYFCYITVDSKPVKVGEQQRHGGLHVDGFQGERIAYKTKVTRNYVATTNGGTQFWEQRFVVADPKRFNAFLGFDLQIDGEPLVAEPNKFYFMDAYTVHESGFAAFDGLRSFLRVTFDLKRFDRLGNTHNPNLDYDWEMVHRTAQDEVAAPRLSDVMASPYFPTA